MKKLIFTLSVAFTGMLNAQTLTPEITSWIINQGGETGYNSIPSNVQQVQYSASYVYVTATCIPGYDIGPWTGNPNTPINENFCYKITRTPVQNTGTATAVSLGHIGVWSNGVSIFNAKDAQSYNNQNIWLRNAYYFEGQGFDECLGHPAPNGEYHHHVNPTCLYDDTDSSQHSPIIGYAFDGFPVYGAWGYTNVDGTGGIRRMRTGYRTRNITDRTTLPDGTVLTSGQYGPALSTYPLGAYIEDYEYVQGYGDLDEHNGRFCVTPEYPNGTYAYFVTVDDALDPVYPYTLGATYYGVVTAGNVGPQSGHNTPGEAVVTYVPDTSTTGLAEDVKGKMAIGPNPAVDYVLVDFSKTNTTLARIEVYGIQGNLITEIANPTATERIPMYTNSQGVYFIKIKTATGEIITRKIIKS